MQQAISTKNGTIIAKRVRVADNPWKRFWGLMGKPAMPMEWDGLWILPCNSIHSLFLRFEFDAVFLDKQGEVLHLIRRMKPWRFSKLVAKGRVVLELDGGKIDALGIQLGDVIQLQDADA